MKIKLVLLFLITTHLSIGQVAVFDNLFTSARSLRVNDGKLYVRVNAEIRVWNNPTDNTDEIVLSASTGFADGFVISGDSVLYADDDFDRVNGFNLQNNMFLSLGFNPLINPDYIEIINGSDIYITVSVFGGGGGPKELRKHNPTNNFFDFFVDLGNFEVTGMIAEGDILYIITRSGSLLKVNTADTNPSVVTLNNALGTDTHGIEIVGETIYYTDRSPASLKSVSKTIVNDSPVTVTSGFIFPTDVKFLNGTFYISDRGNLDVINPIYTYTPPPTVSFADANLKAVLVANTAINTNGDNEIQVSEANAFTGMLDLMDQGITDLTGIEAFTSASGIDISDNNLTSANFSFANSFTTVSGNNMNISTVDLTGASMLESISFNSSGVRQIDISSNPLLTNISFQSGELIAIDFTNNRVLENLNLSGCNLTNIDLSVVPTLQDVNLSNNQLSLLSIANGNNSALANFSSNGNPDLQCIEIDTEFTPPANWVIDATTSYSDDCAAFTDIEDPMVICQDLTISLDATGSIVITPEQIDGGSTDNIGIASLSLDESTFNCDDVGANVVTLTVIDRAGNTNACTATVTVVDDLPPAIQTTNLTVNNDPGLCSAVVGSFNGIESDNCTILEPITYSNVPVGNVFPIGTTTITASIFDVSGNTTSRDFTVTVVDNELPALTVSDTTVHLDSNACTAVVALNATATDNCSATVSYQNVPSGGVFSLGTTTITAVATDPSGNSVSEDFEVTVVDNISPTITGSDIRVLLNQDPDNLCGATVNLNAFISATDNCDSPQITYENVPVDNIFPIGETTITVIAADLSGNNSSKDILVTIVDNVLPVLTVSDLSVNNDEGSCNAVVNLNATATDNCSVTVTYANVPVNNVFPIGTTTVTAIATDGSGNEVMEDFLITVIDNENPLLTVSDINVTVNPDECSAVVQMNTVAQDNCVATISYTNLPANNVFPVGSTMVTAVATDASGNSVSEDFIVTVTDNIAPVITCTPGDLTEISTTDSFTLPDYVADGIATATDNCTATITQDPAAGTQLIPGSYQITFTATDSDGNTDACTKNLNIEKVLSNADSQSNKLLIYPNPVNSILHIESKSTDVEIAIYTVSGKRLLQTTGKTVDMSSFLPGTYLIHITEGDKTVIRRTLKR